MEDVDDDDDDAGTVEANLEGTILGNRETWGRGKRPWTSTHARKPKKLAPRKDHSRTRFLHHHLLQDRPGVDVLVDDDDRGTLGMSR